MKGREMTSAEYKIRTVIILALLLTWAAFAAAKVYTFTVRDRQVLLKRSHPIAWRTAEIPARRDGTAADMLGVEWRAEVFDKGVKTLFAQKLVQLLVEGVARARRHLMPSHPKRRLLCCLATKTHRSLLPKKEHRKTSGNILTHQNTFFNGLL